MHVVVCVKQVPDSSQIRVHPVTNTIMRQGVPAVINPYDLIVLEEALRLKDRLIAAEALRKCIAYGADEAVLITDRVFAGSDTLATSYALASAIRRIGADRPVDMVFCGKQTIDGDTAQVGPGIARRLGYQQLTYVSRIETIDPVAREIVVHRRAEGGVQVLQSRLPCMVTMLEGANVIRFASMDDMFRAARCQIVEWDHKAAGIDEPLRCGLKGSPTVVKKVFAPQPRSGKAEMIKDENAGDAVATLLASLAARHPALAAELQP
jgi:electron transfer flavoprotein beta subunit